MKIFVTTALASLGLVASMAAWAELPAGMAAKPFTPITPNGSGTKAPNYLGISLGKATTDGFCEAQAQCGNDAKAWKASAGVRLNDNLMLEGSYVDFGKQSGTNTEGKTENQSASGFALAGLVGVPVNAQIEAFGKAGLTKWTHEHTANNATIKTDGTDVLVGIGADYNLGNNMGVRAEWERYKDIGKTKPNNDIDLLSLGFIFSSL